MRSKEERSGKKEAERNESKVDVGRLKSPSTVRGEPSSGKELIKVSSSLMNSPSKSHCRIFYEFICKLWWKISIWSPTNKQDFWLSETV